MQILCPASTQELAGMLRWAVNDQNGPVAIRYPRGCDGAYTECNFLPGENAYVHRNGADGVIVTYGTTVNRAMEASQLLDAKQIHCAVLRLTSLHDLSRIDLSQWPFAVVVEDSCDSCGVYESLAYANPRCRVVGINPGRRYITHGKLDTLYSQYGLDSESIVKRVLEVHSDEN
jgi:1-deoxy-D-xylulose-5-phosphate synthase